jgi:hypothetical protein
MNQNKHIEINGKRKQVDHILQSGINVQLEHSREPLCGERNIYTKIIYRH